jgi:hypothetical protein
MVGRRLSPDETVEVAEQDIVALGQKVPQPHDPGIMSSTDVRSHFLIRVSQGAEVLGP